MAKKGLVEKLFSYDAWDEVSDFGLQFYNCKLETQIGTLCSGNEFDSIYVDFESGKIAFYDEVNREVESYTLKLVVDEE